ncbi:hypothetical protein J5A66_09355 [Prevotella sp. oral taxon 475]|uniref:DUF6722 family protein n=1 Tax=Prevotella sp. oral taxon 475 TaxID=712471 RepID=UPI001BACE36F|nr:DUF6722 family protein [Prevotella sp. oral taxon 475]QUB47133.1 hypothetical protein J5A66_09355 [Prevotella sp. oral taxon 475]
MWKEKPGNYLIDVSKYIITGVVITSLFKDLVDKLAIYIVGISLSFIALIAGLILLSSNQQKGGK